MKEVKNIIKLIAVLLPLTLALAIVAVFALNPSALVGNYFESFFVDGDSADGDNADSVDADAANNKRSGSLILESTFGKTGLVEGDENNDVGAALALCNVSGEALEHNFEDGRCTVCGEEEASLEISGLSE